MLQWWLVRLNKKEEKPNDQYLIYRLKEDRLDFWRKACSNNSTLLYSWEVRQVEVVLSVEQWCDEVEKWKNDVFCDRVQFDEITENAFLIEGKKLLEINNHRSELHDILDDWVRPRRSVSPGPRNKIVPTQEALDIIANLPPLPKEFVENFSPEQTARYEYLNEIENKLEQLFANEITWKEFYEWQTPRSWGLKEFDEISGKIDLYSAEYTGGHVTYEQLIENLKGLL